MLYVRLVFLVFFIPLLLSGSSEQWRWIGPLAGEINQLVPDRNNPDIWYAGTNIAVYRSENGARRWQRIHDGNARIYVHPRTSELLLVSGSSLLVSNDYGHTFESQGQLKVNLRNLLWDPQNPNIMYGLADYNLLGSYNHGRTWKHLRQPSPGIPEEYKRCNFNGFFFDEGLILPPGAIYLSGDADLSCYHDETIVPQFWVSHDGGNSWKFLEPHNYFFSTDGAYPEQAFQLDGLEEGRVLRITPFGAEKLHARIPWVSQMMPVPGNPFQLYARAYSTAEYASKQLLFESDDSGRSFRKINRGFPFPITRAQTLPDRQGGLLIGTYGAGLFEQSPSGALTERNNGINEANIYLLAKGHQGQKLYASSYPGMENIFLYSKNEGDRDWKRKVVPFRFFNLASSPGSQDTVVAVSNNGFHVTRDAGRSWKLTGNFKYPGTVAFDPAHPNWVYGSYNFSCIARSQNGGDTWTKTGCTVSDAFVRILVDAFDSRVLYFLTIYGNIYKSTDQAKTFKQLDIGPAKSNVSDLAALPNRKGGYVAVRHSGVYRTVDGGGHWIRTGDARSSYTLRIFPADSAGLLLYLMGESELWKTNDGGVTWKELTKDVTRMPRDKFRDMTDPQFHPIYVATSSGVYASPD